MASPSKLTEQQVASVLESLTGWSVVKGKLHREYSFPDFVHAFEQACVASFDNFLG